MCANSSKRLHMISQTYTQLDVLINLYFGFKIFYGQGEIEEVGVGHFRYVMGNMLVSSTYDKFIPSTIVEG